MGFITGLFSDSGNSFLTAAFALGAVIVLIVLVAWLLKMLSGLSGNAVRGRNRRLSVIDTLAVDQKRQLVIIRRDNVEHLILVGGPQDLLVESGIAVEETPAAAQPSRRPLPMVPGRKAQDKVQPAEANKPKAPTPVVPPAAPAAPATAIEQLRDLGTPANQRGPKSLRHTGLLRPVSSQDGTSQGKTTDISTAEDTDSAKEESSKQGN